MALASTLEQDRAAGGLERRKLISRSGAVHVVSLAITGQEGALRSITMRFKLGGSTVTRLVGKVEGATRFEQLKAGWVKVRADKVAEQNQWRWVVE